MGTYGNIYVNGEEKDYHITNDADPDVVIEFLRDILKDAKTSRDVIHAIYDEIEPIDTWIDDGAVDTDFVDFIYTIDIKNNLIITELGRYDPDEAKDKEMIDEDLELMKEYYGSLGEIKVEDQPDGGKKIILYSKIK